MEDITGKPKRVAITGIGAITPIGQGRDGLWCGVMGARSAVQRISRFDPTQFRSQVAAQVNDFDPLDHIDAQRARRLDRYSQFAVAAAQQAVLDSGLCLSSRDADHTGVYFGSALGGLSFAEEQHNHFVDGGIRAVNNILALTVFGSASSVQCGYGDGPVWPKPDERQLLRFGGRGDRRSVPADPVGDARNHARRWRRSAARPTRFRRVRPDQGYLQQFE